MAVTSSKRFSVSGSQRSTLEPETRNFDVETFISRMADDCIQILTMGDSSSEGEEKYEIYETGRDVFCVIGLDDKRTTAKTPAPKPRYKQSYREAWESMRDFKGWLSGVPGNTSKAYCKLCRKELHCHRLSLLKHKITFKHQKKEEEQKLSRLRGEKKENCSNEDNLSLETAEGSKSNVDSTSLELTGDNSDTEDHLVLPEVNLPLKESSISLTQNEEVNIQSQGGSLSTRVLDVSKGTPASLVQVLLYKLVEGRWTLFHEGLTDSDGRYNYFLANPNEFSEGRYKLHYDVDKYFEKQNQETIFPFIEVAFNVKDISSKYHIPLLITPYGYSTYSGS